ncbi:MAG TPA: hypothetical protein VGK38_12295 [Prolixibacteraceae bacterium]|jgi:hypothetical protein
MLKNKKITYLLITLVALIWGLIFYKIYSNFGGKKQIERNLRQSVIAVESVHGDSIFTLSLNYPDPFLKVSGQTAETPVESAGSPTVVNWPLIEYRGLLTSNGKNESTGLLKVQNSDLLVNQGKIYSAVKIRILTRDSIFLEFQTENRWFPIKK